MARNSTPNKQKKENDIPEPFIKKIGEFFIAQNENGLAILKNDKIFFANKIFADLTGYETSELSQRLFIDLVPLDYKKMVGSSFNTNDPVQSSRRYKLDIISKNESVFPA